MCCAHYAGGDKTQMSWADTHAHECQSRLFADYRISYAVGGSHCWVTCSALVGHIQSSKVFGVPSTCRVNRVSVAVQSRPGQGTSVSMLSIGVEAMIDPLSLGQCVRNEQANDTRSVTSCPERQQCRRELPGPETAPAQSLVRRGRLEERVGRCGKSKGDSVAQWGEYLRPDVFSISAIVAVCSGRRRR